MATIPYSEVIANKQSPISIIKTCFLRAAAPINHPLAAWDCLSRPKDNLPYPFIVPINWWLVQVICASDDTRLHAVDWELVDSVTCGQVRRAFNDAYLIRAFPQLISQAMTESPFTITCPDLLNFCLHLALAFDLAHPIIIPKALKDYTSPNFSPHVLFVRFFGHGAPYIQDELFLFPNRYQGKDTNQQNTL